LVKALTYKDPFSAVYKKYLFTMDGKYLLGGMMIGDTNDYVKLNQMVKSQKELEVPPSQFILGTQNGGEENADDLYENIYSPPAPLLIISLQGRRHSSLLMPQCHQARRGRKG
jgi:hypothetical protein